MLVSRVVAAAKAELAEDLSEGDRTQAQADAKAATLQERVTALVDRVGGPGRGDHGHHGPHDDDDAAATPSPTATS